VGALARAASTFVALRAWNFFGFARLDDHAHERYGRSGRWLRDLAALGEALATAPPLAAALTGADGGRPLGRVAAILVARAAGYSAARSDAAGPADAKAPARERPAGRSLEEWIASARILSVRELRTAIRESRASTNAAGTVAGGRTDADAGTHADASTDADADPDADRVLLRLPVPCPALAAFDEALDLFRSIEGHSASVTEFVEALVGEAQSGDPAAVPEYVARLAHGTPEAQVEAALRRATDAWAALPSPFSDGTLSGVSASLARFRALEVEAGAGDAAAGDAGALDRRIRALVDIENELEARLGDVLAAMAERHDWRRLQFASPGHYAEERLGMSRSRAGETRPPVARPPAAARGRRRLRRRPHLVGGRRPHPPHARGRSPSLRRDRTRSRNRSHPRRAASRLGRARRDHDNKEDARRGPRPRSVPDAHLVERPAASLRRSRPSDRRALVGVVAPRGGHRPPSHRRVRSGRVRAPLDPSPPSAR
jgi:hypothetical protein